MPFTNFFSEECTCECHKNPSIQHCMPCCWKCPKCYKNIKSGCIQSHNLSCTAPELSVTTRKKPRWPKPENQE